MKLLKTALKILSMLLLVGIMGLAVTIRYQKDCPPPETIAQSDDGISAVTHHCYGGPEVLVLQQLEKPVPAANEVLVKVHSAGVNPLDWHYMRGAPYLMRLMSGIGAPAQARLGVDFAGTVEAVGSDVTRFKPGEAVFGGRTGAFGQYITVREAGAIAHKPDNISFDQAGSVAIAAVTALQALQDKGQLQAGQSVLINGASGGVGTFAVQIARAMGAEVTGVSSARNHPLVQSLGANHMIDYKQESYAEGNERYDLIVDMIGNHSLRANSGVLKPGGKLVMVGGGGEGNWVGPIIRPLAAMAQSPFIEQELIMLMATLSPDGMQQLSSLMATGDLVPVVDRTFRLDQVSDAIAYSESGRARGKIVITGINPD